MTTPDVVFATLGLALATLGLVPAQNTAPQGLGVVLFGGLLAFAAVSGCVSEGPDGPREVDLTPTCPGISITWAVRLCLICRRTHSAT
jgi:hypothetical protein